MSAPHPISADPVITPAHSGERLSVRVKGLRLEAEVGVYDSERGRTQPIVLDLRAEVSKSAIHPHGSLGEAVNYAALAELARRIATAHHHDLLEDLAEAIADAIFRDERILNLTLSIDKPTALEDAASVGVTLERWR